MIRSNETSRPPVWEEEAPAESRYRRVQQGVSPSGRNLPGMPLEMSDPDGDDASRRGPAGYSNQRFDIPRSRWWRPSSSGGRALLGFCLLIVVAALGTAAYFVKTYLAGDARFRIAGAENVQAAGLTQVSRADMMQVFGEDIGRNIFFVPLAERRRQLEQIPWIERATVMRMLPDQIRVNVVERKPVAFVSQGGQIGLVDANGVLLSMPPAMMAEHHYSFPVVSGINAADPPGARKDRMAVYARLLADLDSGGERLSNQISEVDLSDPEDAVVTMQEDETKLHFGDEHFLDRYEWYKTHIAEWRQEHPKLVAVDLRYDQQVVLEMPTGTNVSGDASGSAATPSGDNTTDKQSAPKPEAKAPPRAKPQKPAGKGGVAARPGPRNAPRQKTAAIKDAKRRAAAHQAALAVSQRKKALPAVNVGQGQ